MQPVQYKPKLPRYLSFPLGFESIATALDSVPVFAEIDLTFSAYPVLSATDFRRIIDANEPYIVISARYVKWDKGPSLGSEEWVQDYLRGKWELWVYPVARRLRADAKRILLESGMPKIVEWFSCERPSSWYSGRKKCDLVFVPDEQSIRIDTKEEKS